jgi:hypothetical protein
MVIMDLEDGWEKKALIGIGIVVLMIILYAYFIPFYGTPEPSLQSNQVSLTPATPIPYSIPAVNNSTSNNSTTSGNFTLTADQAKNIALNAFPNYTIGTPTYQNNLNINGTIYSAWAVPITLNSTSKTVYIDDSGAIIQIN